MSETLVGNETSGSVIEESGKIAGLWCPLCGRLGLHVWELDGVKQRLCQCHFRNALHPGASHLTPFSFEASASHSILLSWAWNNEEEYEALYTDGQKYPVEEQKRNGQPTFADAREQRILAATTRLNAIAYTLYADSYRHRWAVTMLDVGCGPGEFVIEACKYGYKAKGLEPNPTFTFSGVAPILQGSWKDAKRDSGKESGRYDIITLFDVFEHLTRPAECLTHLYECLEDDGVLVIEMPELGCLDSLRSAVDWKHNRPRQHVCLYGQYAAERLFFQRGFRVLSMYRPVGGKLGKITWFLKKSTAMP